MHGGPCRRRNGVERPYGLRRGRWWAMVVDVHGGALVYGEPRAAREGATAGGVMGVRAGW